jgi:hypothetical protein
MPIQFGAKTHDFSDVEDSHVAVIYDDAASFARLWNKSAEQKREVRAAATYPDRSSTVDIVRASQCHPIAAD